MDRDATTIEVALTRGGKTALAVKGLMFIVPYSAQQEVTRNNKSNLGCSSLPSGQLGTGGARGVYLLLVCTEEWCLAHTFLCVDPTAKAGVNICAAVRHTINWVCKC